MAHARAHAVDVVREWQIDDDIVEALRLIVSELVTNAVVHTVSRSIEITVSSPPLRPL
ncbi:MULTISPECIES: ATP-binding protein [unclassified Streptomyces]|uniref:ATP-binding protein n=1 Tax=unclassified Streptomyces TaxID=2593676 RepID=UPI0032527843